MGVRIEKPRSDNYHLFLAALDRYGNYSEPLEFTINHPGIQQLELSSQDVTGLIGSIKINLPKVYTQRSQEVYPEEVANEEKEILGYRIHLQEVDYNTEEPIGEEEIVDYDAKEINEKGIIYYQTETGKKYEIKIGAYDSVYHPDFNYDLYEQTISQTVVNSTMKIERPDISEALIKPNDLTTTLQGTGLTASDFGDGGIESTYTIQAGVWDDTNNKPVVGGIGLAYNEDDNDIDVQIVADRFRLFDPDVEPNGKPLFATGTVDGTSQIYMNANNIAMIADNPDLSTENFFELSEEGLSINTPGLKLDKAGNAVFNGEISSSQFSLIGGDFTLNQNELDFSITNYSFNFDSNGLAIDTPNFTLDKLGNANYNGDISANQVIAGTLDADNVTVSSGDGATFNLQGNDLTINTNQFTLDSAGNAEFGGDLNAASGSFNDGNVSIDSTGVNINNGGLTVTNSSGTTIIDGTSNMFKIHQTGTATINGESHVTIPFPDLGYRPACLAYIQGTRDQVAGRSVIGYYVMQNDGADSFGIWAHTSSNDIRIDNFYSWALDVRYYVLKEAGI